MENTEESSEMTYYGSISFISAIGDKRPCSEMNDFERNRLIRITSRVLGFYNECNPNEKGCYKKQLDDLRERHRGLIVDFEKNEVYIAHSLTVPLL